MSANPQALFQFAGLEPSLFAPNSRYAAAEKATWQDPDGRTVAYVRRRFLPQPSQLAEVAQYNVAQGDRLDVVAARYLGDPTLFWRIADANAAMNPDDLTATTGRTLGICLPEGIQGGQNAP